MLGSFELKSDDQGDIKINKSIKYQKRPVFLIRRLCLCWLSVLLGTSSFTLSASQDSVASKAAFQSAYSAYQEASAVRNWSMARGSAEQALIEGLKVFDEAGDNVANLRLNFARELIRSNEYPTAKEQLTLCLATKETTKGKESREIVEILVELGKAEAAIGDPEAVDHFRRARDLSSVYNDYEIVANINLTAGNTFFQTRQDADATEFLKPANRYFTNQYGTADLRAGLSALNLGRLQQLQGDSQSALITLTNALKAFTLDQPRIVDLNITTRKMLAIVQESLGKSEMATEQLLEIAKRRADGGDAEPELVYGGSVPATSNTDDVAITGSAVIQFDIDATGRVINTRVVSSSSEIAKTTGEQMVSTQRYSPKMQSGKPVEATSVEFRFDLGQ